jgi:molecular chaperone GrpE (heat shock protein)
MPDDLAAELAEARQEIARLQQENAWAHQKYADLKQRIDQAAPLREQAQQRAEAMPKSPLAHHIRKLLELLDDMAARLP